MIYLLPEDWEKMGAVPADGPPKQLYKTTIVIWTEYDPNNCEIDDLAREATSGDAFCSLQQTMLVTDPSEFPDTEFFEK